MLQVFVPIAQDATLAFPRDTAAPLGRKAQAEHLAVAHQGGWSTTGRQLGPDMALVNIVYDNVQCGQEGFESECYGHVSFGQRIDMAEDSRRNLLLASSG